MGNVARVPRFGRRNREHEREASRGREREAVREREWQASRDAALEDLAAAGDAVGVLDVDIQSPAVPAAAGARFDEAIRAFMRAGEQLEQARARSALVAVGEALERARYEIACTRALLEGVDAPEPRPPCLFDPAHGPSAREVRWAPAGGEDRAVPACCADARRLIDGEHPQVRLIVTAGAPARYWDDPRCYGPLLEGYYRRFGGAQRLATLLAGTALGDAIGARLDLD